MPYSGSGLLCFGLGYCGTALARTLGTDGWRVTGTSRTLNKERPGNLALIRFPASGEDNSRLRRAISEATHILSTIPPTDSGDPVVRACGSLLANAPHLVWVGYLSTTGVYGDTNGRVVDEESAIRPSGPRGERRVKAEKQWLNLQARENLPVHVFRLPGIYGPARSAFDRLRRGKARRIDKPGHTFNRVHVDDIVRTLIASMNRPNPGRIYNVCDDCPAEPANVTLYACQKMGIAPPPVVSFEEAKKSMSPMGLGFWSDNRRVSNARIKAELGVELIHADYKSGLNAIWESERQTG